MLVQHVDVLTRVANSRPWFVPTFNYDFCCTGVYRVDKDQSQVGPLTEHVRREVAEWRSTCPVFNFAGVGRALGNARFGEAEIDPFGVGSAFGELVDAAGSVVWYGAPISSSTIIHHAERMAGGPIYRYDKIFEGEVLVSGQESRRVSLRYHVRPSGRHLDYDWETIGVEIAGLGIFKSLSPENGIYWSSARDLVNYFVERLKANAFSLLDAESRAWAQPLAEKLGRRFAQWDFEEME